MARLVQCWWCGGVKEETDQSRNLSTPARVTHLEAELSQLRSAFIEQVQALITIRSTADQVHREMLVLKQLGEQILKESRP